MISYSSLPSEKAVLLVCIPRQWPWWQLTYSRKLQSTIHPNFKPQNSHSYRTILILKVKVKRSRYRPGVAQRVGKGIALLFHDCGTRRGWVVSSTPRPHFNPGKDPVPILQEAEWTPGQVCTGGKSRPHRYSVPDLPARSSVAIPTELPGPHHNNIIEGKGKDILMHTMEAQEERLYSYSHSGIR